jgi:hypothetical protein
VMFGDGDSIYFHFVVVRGRERFVIISISIISMGMLMLQP